MITVSEFRLRNQIAEIRRIGVFVRSFSRAHLLSANLAQAIDLSLVEWVTNVISYAYPDALEHWIDVRLESTDAGVRVQVVDDGREFNPLNHPPVDTNVPLERRTIGGLGIHMMRKLMDRVEYRREGARNVVTMFKARTSQ